MRIDTSVEGYDVPGPVGTRTYALRVTGLGEAQAKALCDRDITILCDEEPTTLTDADLSATPEVVEYLRRLADVCEPRHGFVLHRLSATWFAEDWDDGETCNLHRQHWTQADDPLAAANTLAEQLKPKLPDPNDMALEEVQAEVNERLRGFESYRVYDDGTGCLHGSKNEGLQTIGTFTNGIYGVLCWLRERDEE